MAAKKQTYLQCEIEIQDNSIVKINNKPIDCEFDETRKKWFTRYLPYSEFDSLDELSKSLVKNSVEFTQARG